MEKRIFRVVSVCVIMAMLAAMVVITSLSVSAFEPLDGDESTGSKTTMGPLDSREEGVSQTISYPEDYYSAVTYGPLDGDESEAESDVPTDPSQSVTDPTETSASESSQTSETQPSESQPSETQPSETQSSAIPTESSQTGSETGSDPATTLPTLPTLPTMPTMPSQSGTSETNPSETDPSASVKTPLYGDANEDNAVNMKDVLLMRKYVAEIPVTICFVNADVNVDAAINMKDVLSVRKYVAELIDHLGPDT